MNQHNFVPCQHTNLPEDEMIRRAAEFYAMMNQRRSIRDFSDKAVPRALIEQAIRTAGTAPSGAHREPWRFVATSNPGLKRDIRIAAEREEKESYEGGRMPPEWREALLPLGTDWQKPYLETVPWIVVVFAEMHSINPDGSKRKNYYVQESVGIACGMFIAAIHQMGLCTLTHTPSPMGFLSKILNRPENEKPYILFPIGYPAEGATVPDLQRKALDDLTVWFE